MHSKLERFSFSLDLFPFQPCLKENLMERTELKWFNNIVITPSSQYSRVIKHRNPFLLSCRPNT